MADPGRTHPHHHPHHLPPRLAIPRSPGHADAGCPAYRRDRPGRPGRPSYRANPALGVRHKWTGSRSCAGETVRLVVTSTTRLGVPRRISGSPRAPAQLPDEEAADETGSVDALPASPLPTAARLWAGLDGTGLPIGQPIAGRRCADSRSGGRSGPAAPRTAALSPRMRRRSHLLRPRVDSLICTDYEMCYLVVTTVTTNTVNSPVIFS